MSAQFGRWNFEGPAPAADYIEKVNATLAPYGPDSNESYSKDGMKILYRAFCTTKESWRETQPHVSPSGAVLTWDGRLDNRAELLRELHGALTTNFAATNSFSSNFSRINSGQAEAESNTPTLPDRNRDLRKTEGWGAQATADPVRANSVSANSVNAEWTDVEIVAAAYEKWGDKCLGKLIGDWALSIWNPRAHSVLLAKDPIGTKHLYYSFDHNHLTWSTILDPLVLFAGRTFQICEEYIAGWFAIMFPAAHLTPYVGIHAVPPSCSVLLQPNKHANHGVKHIVTKYWDFGPDKQIRYSTDAEYEEHFRTALATAVQRRLRSDRPVLAELSGGMDSSSIVCIADLVIAQAQGNATTSRLNITPIPGLAPRLDTISWFDDSYDHLEPDTNELHWISKVEQKRHRSGFHINFRELKQEVGSKRPFMSEFDDDRFAVTPIPNRHLPEYLKRYAKYMNSQGHKVTLSGIGGGEVTGGDVPTPTPELQNLLARARFYTLAQQLNAWGAKMRKPRLPLLWDAVRGFFPRRVHESVPNDMLTTPWFRPSFAHRNRLALCGYPSKIELFGPLPSFQNKAHILDNDRRLLAYFGYRPEMVCDVRYPYFDRGLLEFMYAIPQEQIVRVGQRRSLMKRALVGIVPDELLNRRPKAFVPQEPMKDNSTEWPNLVEMGQHIVSSSIGIIDPNRFWGTLEKARGNEEIRVGDLKRALLLESWLRHLAIQGILTTLRSSERGNYSSSLEAKELIASAQPKSSAS